MFGTPVINYPQSAVFNMNGIQQRVMAINGQAEIRPVSQHTSIPSHKLMSCFADDVH
jgi:2-oxoglutarate dehydrogenase E2 component (dihydrolipoamide succinyltransferase)